MRQHVMVLGVLYIVLGSMGLVGAAVVLVLFGGSAGVVGIVAQDEPAAQVAVPILGALAAGLFCLIALLSAPGIVAGIGLVKLQPWARILGLVLSVINLLNIPFGTIVGVYGLWVLFSYETEQLFRGIEPGSSAPPVDTK